MFRFLLLVLSCIVSIAKAQSEYISLFNSTVTIEPSGWLAVQERITVNLANRRHGIVREFPTTDTSFKLFQYHADFRVQRVLLNDQPVAYTIATMANGKAIYIGDNDVYLAPGSYTYTIEYRVNRLIGFFKEHDELWFNITGNGWRLPIASVQAQVILPDSISANQITADCYTGYYGSQERHCTTQINDHIISIATTKMLNRSQGLTCVITWPKGFITLPTWFDHLWYFVKDNMYMLWLMMVLALLIIFYLFIWFVRIKPSRTYGTIIPLFYPPESLTPSAVRYMYKQGFDTMALAAEIVNMAVAGILTIQCTASNWGRVKYELQKTGKQPTLPLHEQLKERLFPAEKEVIVLDNSQDTRMEKVKNYLQNYLSIHFASYLENQGSIVVTGTFCAMVAALALLFFDPFVYELPWFWLFIVTTIGISTLFYYGTRGYTPAGQKIYEQIEGFKLFLSTTETERLAVIGTPPTKTPELYETYLPYAMALDVEKAWTAQFAPLFEQMTRNNNAYTPAWYHGYHRGRFGSYGFASGIRSGLNTAIGQAIALRHTPISSSGFRSGSRSGSGGKGFSGGGGGGGGGGAW